MNTTQMELVGVVTGASTIECVDAPEHLKVLHLEPSMMRSAVPGNRVKIAYRTSPSRCFWVVAEILGDANTFYTCSECEANFKGQIPTHKFRGVICPGSY